MRQRVVTFIKQRKLLLVIAVMVLIGAGMNGAFLSTYNVNALLIDVSIIGCLALAEMLVMITGGIDISIGYIASVSSVMTAFMMLKLEALPAGLNLVLSILSAVIVCALLGALNGIGVVYLKLPPLVSTLCGMWIARGVAFYALNGVATPYVVEDITMLARRGLGPIPFSLLLLIAILIYLNYSMRHKETGRNIYAVGGNEYAANISGVNVRRTKMLAYVLSSVLAAVGGIILGAYTGSGYARGAANYEMYAIASAAIGGVSLLGGVGDPINVFLGVFVLRIINRLMVIAGLSNLSEGLWVGIIIIAAMVISTEDFSGVKSYLRKRRIGYGKPAK